MKKSRGFEVITTKKASYELARKIISILCGLSKRDIEGTYKYTFIVLRGYDLIGNEVLFKQKDNDSYEFIVNERDRFTVSKDNINETFKKLVDITPSYALYNASKKSFTGESYPVNAFDSISNLMYFTNGHFDVNGYDVSIRRKSTKLYITIITDQDVDQIIYSLSDDGTCSYTSSLMSGGKVLIEDNFAVATMQVMTSIQSIIKDSIYESFLRWLAPNAEYEK